MGDADPFRSGYGELVGGLPNKVPENTKFCWRSAGVLLRFWRSGVLVLAFCPPGVLPWRSGGAWRSGFGVLGGLAFWVWRSGRSGVLGPAFLAFWRSGWRSALAFWGLAFCRRSGVLPWRSAGVLAFCLAFWRSAWRSGVLPGVLAFCLAFCLAWVAGGVRFFKGHLENLRAYDFPKAI